MPTIPLDDDQCGESWRSQGQPSQSKRLVDHDFPCVSKVWSARHKQPTANRISKSQYQKEEKHTQNISSFALTPVPLWQEFTLVRYQDRHSNNLERRIHGKMPCSPKCGLWHEYGIQLVRKLSNDIRQSQFPCDLQARCPWLWMRWSWVRPKTN